jgi:hypothetical protein
VIAFEISVNGHHIRTVSVGEFGMLTAEVMWARIRQNSGTIHEEFRTLCHGLEGNEGDSLQWPDAPLKVGDAVTVRIVEVDSPGDSPSGRTTREELRAHAKQRRLEREGED